MALSFCGKCKLAIPCYCIEYSLLPDWQKCRCNEIVQPVQPPSTIELIFEALKEMFNPRG